LKLVNTFTLKSQEYVSAPRRYIVQNYGGFLPLVIEVAMVKHLEKKKNRLCRDGKVFVAESVSLLQYTQWGPKVFSLTLI